MAHTSRRLLVGVVAPIVLLCAGCGGGVGSKAGSGSGAGQVGAAEADASSAAAALNALIAKATASAEPAPTGTVSQVSLRFVNLYTTSSKQAGPALDIYDTQEGVAAKPLISDLGYGAVSSYVHPHATNGVSQFYAIPTGEDPVAKQTDAKGLGGVQDDGSHPQESIRLTGDSDSLEAGPLAGLSFSTFVEKGSDNGSKAPVAPAPPTGQGEILVDASAFSGLTPSTLNYLLIDTSCAPPLNGDPNVKDAPQIFAADGQAPVSNFALFATTAGAHQVSVDIEQSGVTPTCASLTTKQSTSTVNVAAGQQILAFLYGTSPTDAHIVFAPIAP
jgi:hypothetical protein